MMYVKWLIYFVLNLPIMLLCYLTNGLAVLSCDKNGEARWPFKKHQTWDDSVYSDDVVHKKELPVFCLYDYDKHYAVRYDRSDRKLAAVNQGRYYSDCINNDFTLKEKLQRFICGCYWLTRNCGYGYAFWWFGTNIVPGDVAYTKTGDVTFGTYDNSFTYSNSSRICTIFGYDIFWNIYAGWKYPKNTDKAITRCMLAVRLVSFKFKKAV